MCVCVCVKCRRRTPDVPRQLAGHQGHGGLHETGGRALPAGHAGRRGGGHRRVGRRQGLRGRPAEGDVVVGAGQTAAEPARRRRNGLVAHHQLHVVFSHVTSPRPDFYSMAFTGFLPGYPRLQWATIDSTGLQMVTQGFTGFYSIT